MAHFFFLLGMSVVGPLEKNLINHATILQIIGITDNAAACSNVHTIDLSMHYQEYVILREGEYVTHNTTALQPLGVFTTFCGDIHNCGISQLFFYIVLLFRLVYVQTHVTVCTSTWYVISFCKLLIF